MEPRAIAGRDQEFDVDALEHLGVRILNDGGHSVPRFAPFRARLARHVRRNGALSLVPCRCRFDLGYDLVHIDVVRPHSDLIRQLRLVAGSDGLQLSRTLCSSRS